MPYIDTTNVAIPTSLSDEVNQELARLLLEEGVRKTKIQATTEAIQMWLKSVRTRSKGKKGKTQ